MSETFEDNVDSNADKMQGNVKLRQSRAVRAKFRQWRFRFWSDSVFSVFACVCDYDSEIC